MNRQERKDEEQKPVEKTPQDARKPQAPADPTAPKPKYVFKIVPADPKNSLDFEDTADK